MTQLRITTINISMSLSHQWLRPRWHPAHQHFSQTPDMIGETRRQRRCVLSPALPRLYPMGRIGSGQAQAVVRQHEVMVRVENRQLLTQSCFVLA